MLFKISRILVTGALFLFVLSVRCARADDNKDALKSFLARAQDFNTKEAVLLRPEFIEAVEISRLPVVEQKQKLGRAAELFEDAAKNNLNFWDGIGNYPPDVRATLAEFAHRSPDELADALTFLRGGRALLRAQKYLMRRVFLQNQAALTPILKEDFRSVEKPRVQNALFLLSWLGQPTYGESWPVKERADAIWLSSFYEDVAAVYKHDQSLRESATYTLRKLDDPRAISLLAQNDADVVRCYDTLNVLSENRPADPALIKFLYAHDPKTRSAATYALSNSGDGVLAPHVLRLLHDSSSGIRTNAARMGFHLKDKFYERVRPALVKALSDQEMWVRIETARGFAKRGDGIAAQTLYALVQDPTLEVSDPMSNDGRKVGTLSNFWMACDIVQAIQDLTGNTIGFDTSSNSWFPSSKWNKEGRAKFFEWIKKNTITGIPATMRIYLLDQSVYPEFDSELHAFATRSGRHSAFLANREIMRISKLLANAYNLKIATAGFTENNQPAVYFELRPESARRIAALTEKLAGQDRYLVIFVDDDYVLSFPVQTAWTNGKGCITGTLKNVDQARVMATRLNAGCAPSN